MKLIEWRRQTKNELSECKMNLMNELAPFVWMMAVEWTMNEMNEWMVLERQEERSGEQPIIN